MQRKRFNELERQKKHEILQSLKAERDLSKEIVSTLRLSTSSGSYEAKLSGSKKNASVMTFTWNIAEANSFLKTQAFFEKTGEGFFITDK